MHEAGFDAYMTGATFIRLLNLEGELDLSAASVSSELVLYRYINRLYVALGDELYWNLTEDSTNESRAWRVANNHARAMARGDTLAVDSATSLSDDSCSADEDDQCSSSADGSVFDDLAPELDALSLSQ
ncbi:hypothetical protein GGI19_005061 [Coemansia pectinata]|nr:hypothetical protein GGI19_005061 [Coemansia pectinata]